MAILCSMFLSHRYIESTDVMVASIILYLAVSLAIGFLIYKVNHTKWMIISTLMVMPLSVLIISFFQYYGENVWNVIGILIISIAGLIGLGVTIFLVGTFLVSSYKHPRILIALGTITGGLAGLLMGWTMMDLYLTIINMVIGSTIGVVTAYATYSVGSIEFLNESFNPW